ncbi:hypothetical protein LL127_09300 [Clostridium estertheticum]|nr:hypothetical protein [Clostridium estertheticum]MCB2306060.1 hypothetical protein [Clostridium estertheticum]MCB2346583.1 hypothetical protein [Clostridium estertheticum]WAG47610.1 hypothetical protein LL127_09300 [Clostridium estertheticum]
MIKGLKKKTYISYIDDKNNSTSLFADTDYKQPSIRVDGTDAEEKGWAAANGRNVFSITIVFVNMAGAPFIEQGYWVEYETGKLFRWEQGIKS